MSCKDQARASSRVLKPRTTGLEVLQKLGHLHALLTSSHDCSRSGLACSWNAPTSFFFCLNEMTPDLEASLPPTDSRRRGDVRALEQGRYTEVHSPMHAYRHCTAALLQVRYGPLGKFLLKPLLAPGFACPHLQAVIVCCCRCQVLLRFPLPFFCFTSSHKQEYLACTPCVSLVRSGF